jgi:hypothetical protein
MTGKWNLRPAPWALCLALAMYAMACTEDPSINNANNSQPDMTVDMTPDMTVDMTPDMTVDVTPDMTVDMTPDMTVDVTPDMTADMMVDMTPDMDPDMDLCAGVACNTAPMPSCDGTNVVAYVAMGTCDPTDGSCSYAEAMRTDCAAMGQTCMMGGCQAPAPENCDDMVDNDGDGMADCADTDCAMWPACQPAQPVCLIISQLMEGSSNNKAIELYNCGAAGSADLNLSGYLLCQTNRNSMGVAGNTLTTPLVGTLAAGAVTVFCHSGETVLPMGVCNGMNRINGQVLGFNGNDTVYIVRDVNRDGACDPGDTVLDAFGHLRGDTGASPSWADTTYERCDLTPFDGAGSAFDPHQPVRYVGAPQNTVTGFGQAPSMSGCPMFAVEVCDDMIDNDLDGRTDCDDAQCAMDVACLPPDPCMGVVCNMPPAPVCDGSSAVTYQMMGTCMAGMCGYAEATRTDCATTMRVCSAGACVAPPAEVCNDNIDNDLDGQLDCLDSDCAMAPSCIVDPCMGVTCTMPPAATCDGNAAVTYQAMGTCNPANGTCSYAEAMRTDCGMQQCTNGVCVPRPMEICADMMDNDGDGAIDCADSDCAAFPACQPAGPCLIISQYMEGLSNNKALELYNCGAAALNLDDYLLCQTNRPGDTGGVQGNTLTTPLTGSLAAGAVTVYCHSNEAVLPMGLCTGANRVNGQVLGFNGNDSVYIVRDLNDNNTCDPTDAVMDAFGHITGAGPTTPWKDLTYDRCDLTPYDGSGMSFNPLMPVRYTESPVNTITGFGIAPVAGCP